MSWNQTPTNEFLMHFEDDNGKPATVRTWVATTETDPAGGACATIADATQALSASLLSKQEIIARGVQSAPGTPSDGPYSRGADKLCLVLRTGSGTPLLLQIGAPKESDFDAGTIDVLPTDTNVDALITALKAHAVDAEGNAIIGLQRGWRRRPPRRKHQ